VPGFDRDLWWGRAWDRHRRALLRDGANPFLITQRWAREALSVADLQSVVNWCEARGINVQFAKKVAAVFDQNTRTITVSSRLSPDRQLHVLLHECGHVLVGDNPRFAAGYPTIPEKGEKLNFSNRLACLEEEIEAWNRGWNLARRLGLRVDPLGFEKTRTECLRTYVKWANQR
jgi:IrrE N-terminal-like domain